MMEKVTLHSGIVVKNAYAANYIIVNDTVRIRPIENNKEKYQIIASHRYIDYCIENRKYYSLQDHEFIHLLPLPFKVPIECFKDIYIHFEGFSIFEIKILELFAETVGAKIELSK